LIAVTIALADTTCDFGELRLDLFASAVFSVATLIAALLAQIAERDAEIAKREAQIADLKDL
jgi:hypothetical protein